MTDNNYVGNISTIAKFLVCMIFPYVSAYGISESMLTAVLSLILGFIIALLDAKYPNTFKWLGNASQEEPTMEDMEDGC